MTQHSKQNEKKTQAGVWTDHHEAFLIAAADASDEAPFKVLETIETTAPEHNRTSEHTIHNAENALRIKHFNSLAAHLANYDEILVFGPGTAQEELRNHLGDNAQFRGKKITIDSADRLTRNQMIAKVRDFFQR